MSTFNSTLDMDIARFNSLYDDATYADAPPRTDNVGVDYDMMSAIMSTYSSPASGLAPSTSGRASESPTTSISSTEDVSFHTAPTSPGRRSPLSPLASPPIPSTATLHPPDHHIYGTRASFETTGSDRHQNVHSRDITAPTQLSMLPGAQTNARGTLVTGGATTRPTFSGRTDTSSVPAPQTPRHSSTGRKRPDGPAAAESGPHAGPKRRASPPATMSPNHSSSGSRSYAGGSGQVAHSAHPQVLTAARPREPRVGQHGRNHQRFLELTTQTTEDPSDASPPTPPFGWGLGQLGHPSAYSTSSSATLRESTRSEDRQTPNHAPPFRSSLLTMPPLRPFPLEFGGSSGSDTSNERSSTMSSAYSSAFAYTDLSTATPMDVDEPLSLPAPAAYGRTGPSASVLRESATGSSSNMATYQTGQTAPTSTLRTLPAFGLVDRYPLPPNRWGTNHNNMLEDYLNIVPPPNSSSDSNPERTRPDTNHNNMLEDYLNIARPPNSSSDSNPERTRPDTLVDRRLPVPHVDDWSAPSEFNRSGDDSVESDLGPVPHFRRVFASNPNASRLWEPSEFPFPPESASRLSLDAEDNSNNDAARSRVRARTDASAVRNRTATRTRSRSPERVASTPSSAAGSAPPTAPPSPPRAAAEANGVEFDEFERDITRRLLRQRRILQDEDAQLSQHATRLGQEWRSSTNPVPGAATRSSSFLSVGQGSTTTDDHLLPTDNARVGSLPSRHSDSETLEASIRAYADGASLETVTRAYLAANGTNTGISRDAAAASDTLYPSFASRNDPESRAAARARFRAALGEAGFGSAGFSNAAPAPTTQVADGGSSFTRHSPLRAGMDNGPPRTPSEVRRRVSLAAGRPGIASSTRAAVPSTRTTTPSSVSASTSASSSGMSSGSMFWSLMDPVNLYEHTQATEREPTRNTWGTRVLPVDTADNFDATRPLDPGGAPRHRLDYEHVRRHRAASTANTDPSASSANPPPAAVAVTPGQLSRTQTRPPSEQRLTLHRRLERIRQLQNESQTLTRELAQLSQSSLSTPRVNGPSTTSGSSSTASVNSATSRPSNASAAPTAPFTSTPSASSAHSHTAMSSSAASRPSLSSMEVEHERIFQRSPPLTPRSRAYRETSEATSAAIQYLQDHRRIEAARLSIETRNERRNELRAQRETLSARLDAIENGLFPRLGDEEMGLLDLVRSVSGTMDASSASRVAVASLWGDRPLSRVVEPRAPDLQSLMKITPNMSAAARENAIRNIFRFVPHLAVTRRRDLAKKPVATRRCSYQELNDDDVEKDECCAVCQDDYTPEDTIAVTACKHMYHASCLDTWHETPAASTCPMCRRDLAVLAYLAQSLPEGATAACDLWMNARAEQYRAPSLNTLFGL